jgi:hypothetical protein
VTRSRTKNVYQDACKNALHTPNLGARRASAEELARFGRTLAELWQNDAAFEAATCKAHHHEIREERWCGFGTGLWWSRL